MSIPKSKIPTTPQTQLIALFTVTKKTTAKRIMVEISLKIRSLKVEYLIMSFCNLL